MSKKRLENYGYTAEQILAKIERDSSVEAILAHLLKETKAVEIERLLLFVLPRKYLAEWDEIVGDPALSRLLVHCFRTAFEQASDDIKKKVAKRFVSTLKEESESAVLSYWTAFFRASDMKYLSSNDVDLVVDHMLSRLTNNPSDGLFTALDGIGYYLQKGLISKFVDPLVRLATRSSQFSEDTKVALLNEYSNTSSETDKLILERLSRWVETLKNGNQPERAATVEELKDSYESSYP